MKIQNGNLELMDNFCRVFFACSLKNSGSIENKGSPLMDKTRPILRKDNRQTFPNRSIIDTNRTFFATNTTRIVMDLRVALTFTPKIPIHSECRLHQPDSETQAGERSMKIPQKGWLPLILIALLTIAALVSQRHLAYLRMADHFPEFVLFPHHSRVHLLCQAGICILGTPRVFVILS